MRAIVVGSGAVARELLRRLGDRWNLALVDVSRDELAEASGIRPVRVVEGDGSSRLILQRAGLAEADALLAVTNDDEVNLEACRIARAAGIRRLLAVAIDPERLGDFRELGVSVVSPAALAARRIELGLETRRVSSMAFADGRAEAIEFRIAHDSPMRGKALRELHPTRWTAGALLREGELIVPHGDTVLAEGDRITVVGAGADFADIVRTFTSGETRFPLDYGKWVALPLEASTTFDGVVGEAAYVARNSKSSGLMFVHQDPASVRDEQRASDMTREAARVAELAEGAETRLRTVDGNPGESLRALSTEESIGLIVIPCRRGWNWRAVQRGFRFLRQANRPVLLSRASHPYQRIVVPARRSPAGQVAAKAAIDVARLSGAQLVAVAAVEPGFIAGPEAMEESRKAVAWLEEEAAVQGVAVQGRVLQGNPVRTLIAASDDADLLVLGAGVSRLAGRRLTGRFVAQRAPRSVLLVPVPEGT